MPSPVPGVPFVSSPPPASGLNAVVVSGVSSVGSSVSVVVVGSGDCSSSVVSSVGVGLADGVFSFPS